ncbi:unnamed protein product [Trifolium pratense]|uniref:Uncharacterized protein n=1 Tax=Trifolium pratense TaxID=57577 RepID=A0ACB0JVS2_TRIPR|nr:unnamed protein product [Trifolium pratense]
MDNMNSFWQLGDELRGHSKASEDHKWLMVASKLAEQRSKAERFNNLDLSKGPLDSKFTESMSKSSLRNGVYNMNAVYQKSNANLVGNMNSSKYSGNVQLNKDPHSNNNDSNNNNNNENNTNATDKRFKTLPAAETLPRNEVLGGYIFVCNNDTMQEDLKRQLFGLPPRYRDSLHGIFEAATFGGSNIDPTAWEDKKCKGESRFPAQVRIRVRKICKALEEDSFRPVLHHYDGPKFCLELSVPETLDLMDLCEQAGSAA